VVQDTVATALNTIPGQKYSFSFDWLFEQQVDLMEFNVYINSSQIMSIFRGVEYWRIETADFIAADSAAKLTSMARRSLSPPLGF
jgi:hypothetical protein